MGGAEAERQWHALQARMAPLQAGAALLPAAAIRGDLGIAVTAGARYGPGLIKAGLVAGQLTGPFSGVCVVASWLAGWSAWLEWGGGAAHVIALVMVRGPVRLYCGEGGGPMV